jgi:hypothetical protein
MTIAPLLCSLILLVNIGWSQSRHLGVVRWAKLGYLCLRVTLYLFGQCAADWRPRLKSTWAWAAHTSLRF